ncbi:MAG: RloB family protein [Oscillospiraceae bacterium]|nr:RloB family protein [Oscillospiraceae bacterium]
MLRKNRAKKPTKEINQILIVCGGQTEKIYFDLFAKKLKNVSVKTVNTHPNCDPMGVVQKAVKEKLNYKEIWAVFDYDNDKKFNEAIEKAEDQGIKCAYSNLAFEYWFLLHYKNISRAMNEQKLKTELGKKDCLDCEYKKDKDFIEFVYQKISSKTDTAENRAKIIHEENEKNNNNPSDWQSCTTVYMLSKYLREYRKATT